MNNTFKKALCISAICIFFTTNITYADTNYDQQKNNLSKIEKQIKKLEKNINYDKNEYTMKLDEVANIYLFLNKPEKALKILDKKEKFVIENEGIYSTNLVPIALKKAEIYSFSVIDTNLAENNIKKAEEIIKKNPTNKNLKIDYLNSLVYIAREKDEQYTALKYLKELDKLSSTDAVTEMNIKLDISETYGVLKDFKNAKKSLNTAYTIATEEYTKGNQDALYNYYISLINYYKHKLEYNNAINTYNKLDNILKNDKTASEQIKFNAIYSLANVYKEFKYFDEFKKLVDDKKGVEIDNDELKSMLQNMQIDYYFEIGDFEQYKDFINKQKKLNKKYTSKHLIRDLYVQEKLANYYEETGNINKAISLVQQDLKRIENIKDEYPGVYGFKLKELSDLYKGNNETDKAIDTYKMAISYTESLFPNNSYRRIEELKEISELYLKKKDYKQALSYVNEAIELINKIDAKKTTGAIDIYNCAYEIYFDTRNIEKATQTINKMIEISSEIYGENHIKTMDKLLKKSYLLEITNKIEEEKELIEKIKKTDISGFDYDFETDFNRHLTYKSIGIDNELAIEYALKTKENAKKQKQIAEANDLIAEIYKQQGKKLKALQYKLK